jgi:hypothetical protein
LLVARTIEAAKAKQAAEALAAKEEAIRKTAEAARALAAEEAEKVRLAAI